MVHVDEVTLATLKGGGRKARLEMTPDERKLAGQYFRIQLPICDRGMLKEQANILRRIAAKMDVCSSMFQQRDFELISVIKYEVALANASARTLAFQRLNVGDRPAFGAETQNNVGQAIVEDA